MVRKHRRTNRIGGSPGGLGEVGRYISGQEGWKVNWEVSQQVALVRQVMKWSGDLGEPIG